jgi:Putative transposase
MPRLGFRGFTGKLRLAGSTAELIDQQHWRTFLDGLYHKHWVVYAKPPFAGPDHVFRYLGRYTHRIAISNHRLVAFDNGRVSFTMKDYTQQGLFKVMSYLKHEDFLMLC